MLNESQSCYKLRASSPIIGPTEALSLHSFQIKMKEEVVCLVVVGVGIIRVLFVEALALEETVRPLASTTFGGL